MAERKNVARKKKAIRSTAKLTTLDDFLSEEGTRDEFEAIAVKEVLAWQIGQAMKEKNISRNSSLAPGRFRSHEHVALLVIEIGPFIHEFEIGMREFGPSDRACQLVELRHGCHA